MATLLEERGTGQATEAAINEAQPLSGVFFSPLEFVYLFSILLEILLFHQAIATMDGL